MKQEHTYVDKGWGFEDIIVNNDLYCGKVLHFEEFKRCSYHYHKLKTETFFLRKGMLMVTYGWTDDILEAKETVLMAGDIFHIPIGLRHQMFAMEESELFEFSTQDFVDDSYRVIKGD